MSQAIKIELSAEDRAHLKSVVARVQAAITAFEKAGGQDAAALAKEKDLQAKIAAYEKELDPTDDRQLERLAKLHTHLDAVRRKISAGANVSPAILQDLQGYAQGAGRNLSEFMRPLYHECHAVVAGYLRPFWRREGDSAYAAREVQFLNELSGFLGNAESSITRAGAYERAKECVRQIELLLKGESPFKFPFATPVPELELFAA